MIPKGLLIAAGVGALGVGAYMLLENDDDAGDPAAEPAGAGPATGAPAGAPAGIGAPAAIGSPATATRPGGAEQVGPYTLIPDPGGSATRLVVETATQQPVGFVDPQGNFSPLPAQDASSGTVPAAPAAVGAPAAQARVGASQEAQLAQALFATAGDGSVGSARSDAAAGSTALADVPIAAANQQVGAYTIIQDPASGAQVVFETATQQPVGVLDQQGNLLPIDPRPVGAAVQPSMAPSSRA